MAQEAPLGAAETHLDMTAGFGQRQGRTIGCADQKFRYPVRKMTPSHDDGIQIFVLHDLSHAQASRIGSPWLVHHLHLAPGQAVGLCNL